MHTVLIILSYVGALAAGVAIGYHDGRKVALLRAYVWMTREEIDNDELAKIGNVRAVVERPGMVELRQRFRKYAGI